MAGKRYEESTSARPAPDASHVSGIQKNTLQTGGMRPTLVPIEQ